MVRGWRVATCAICVDLDPVACYLDKRGLVPGPTTDLNAVYAEGLDRFLELFDEFGIRATLFVVGRDGKRPDNAARLRAAAAAGHEIANHSFSHPPSLARLAPHALDDEVRRAGDDLQATIGQPVVGFRAPGWNVSRGLYRCLERLGYAYDSSLVPLPVKAWAIRFLHGLGRRTPSPLFQGQAIWPSPPGHPYRVDPERPWRAGQAALWEIPCGFAPWPPVPLNMTSLAMLGNGFARTLLVEAYRLVSGVPVFTFHGLDLVDAGRSIGPIGLHKPGLDASVTAKREAVRRVLGALLRGRTSSTLRDLVSTL